MSIILNFDKMLFVAKYSTTSYNYKFPSLKRARIGKDGMSDLSLIIVTFLRLAA